MMTTDRTYPYIAWTLTPSFKAVPIELVEYDGMWGGLEFDRASSGKLYGTFELYADKDKAFAAGREKLVKQQAKLDKMQTTINKRRAALDKAEASK